MRVLSYFLMLFIVYSLIKHLTPNPIQNAAQLQKEFNLRSTHLLPARFFNLQRNLSVKHTMMRNIKNMHRRRRNFPRGNYNTKNHQPKRSHKFLPKILSVLIFLSSSQVCSSTQIFSLGAQFGDIKRQIKGALLSKFSQSSVLLWVSGSLLVSVVEQFGRWANCCLADWEENNDSDESGIKQHGAHKRKWTV